MKVQIQIKAESQAILEDIAVCAAKYWTKKTIKGNIMTLTYIYESFIQIHDDVDSSQVDALGGEILSIN